MSSGVDFTNMINNVIRPNGDGRQDEKAAIALLEAAQKSELSLAELLLLINPTFIFDEFGPIKDLFQDLTQEITHE